MEIYFPGRYDEENEKRHEKVDGIKDIIQWLIALEQRAGEFYGGASTQFRENREFARFLNALSEDEAWHYHIMGSAAEFLRMHEDIACPLTVDHVKRKEIEAHFHRNSEMLTAGKLTEDALIDCIISTEFSEFNQMFQFVMNTLKDKSREFSYAASTMQGHLLMIERFLGGLPRGQQYMGRIRHIPAVWEKKILVVEDSGPIRELLAYVLKSEGAVHAVEDGKQGFNALSREYYDVIVSDIEMPRMSGIELYRKVRALAGGKTCQFIFFSSTDKREHLRFIEQYGITLIRKPADIGTVREAVRTILAEPAGG